MLLLLIRSLDTLKINLYMKKIITGMVASLMMLSSVAMADQIELKGFKLGMTKKEFKKTWKSQRVKYHQNLASFIIPLYTTTLAGVNVDKPTVWWSKKPAIYCRR